MIQVRFDIIGVNAAFNCLLRQLKNALDPLKRLKYNNKLVYSGDEHILQTKILILSKALTHLPLMLYVLFMSYSSFLTITFRASVGGDNY
jgi:hypothetical protein